MLHFSYALLVNSFLFSFMFLVAHHGSHVPIRGAWGLKTITSKNVFFSNLPPHTPLAEISNRAPSCVFAVAPQSCYG